MNELLALPFLLLLGVDHLTENQTVIALEELKEFKGVVVFTPYFHPLRGGWRHGNTIKIYDVSYVPDFYFRCLLRHEVNEPQKGELHSVAEVIGEC